MRRRGARICVAAATAVLVFCCCMWSARSFTCANNHVLVPRTSTTAVSVAARANGDEKTGADENGSSGKRRYKQRHQRRQSIRRRRSSAPTSGAQGHSKGHSKDNQQKSQCEEGQVHEWLLQSTSLVLGEELTMQLVRGEYDLGGIVQTNNNCNEDVPSHYSTAEEFVLNAESVAGAWCQWSSCCSIDGGDAPRRSLDEGAVRCSTMDAAVIVNAIVCRALGAIDRQGEKLGAADSERKVLELMHSAIEAWSTVGGGGGDPVVERLCGWLNVLQKRFGGSSSGQSESVQMLYEECYRWVIKACIRSRKRKYLDKAIHLLDELRTQPIAVSVSTFNLVLYGLANCEPCEENARRAEELLEDMISRHCNPDANALRQVVIAWTKSGSESAARNARRVLDRMISDFPELDPDPSTFNALMTLYLDLGETWRAMEVFSLMSSLGALPDTYSVNLILKAISPFSSLKEMDAAEKLLDKYHMQADVQSYNILIDAWAKSHLQEGASRAELLLDRLETKCQQDESIAPDSYSYVGVLNAIDRSTYHEAKGTWAEQILHRMEEMHSIGLVEKPTTPVYNALLNALITSDEAGSLHRAEDLFSYLNTADLANTRTFNTMLKGYARASRRSDGGRSYSLPRKAEELLGRMEMEHHSKADLRPDKFSYTTVITAYGRSNVKRKAAKAILILQRMIDSYLDGNSAARPTTYAFNAVLNACSHTRLPEERLEAFTIACSTLILQREWAKPDHTTYGVFLQVCARLLPTDETRQWSVVETVFNSCIQEGQCGELVLKNLKEAAGMERFEALVGRFLTDDHLEIPAQWRRNVAGDSTSALKFRL